jgi:hypothetical protein
MVGNYPDSMNDRFGSAAASQQRTFEFTVPRLENHSVAACDSPEDG